MPPLPAQVMMCDNAKLVTEMSERVPVGVPAQGCAERVARVFDDREAVPIGDLADAVPVGRVAGQVRHEDRAGLRADHLLDRSTSTLKVSGSTSTNTGTRLLRMSGARSVENVTGEVITSEPGSRSSSSIAR